MVSVRPAGPVLLSVTASPCGSVTLYRTCHIITALESRATSTFNCQDGKVICGPCVLLLTNIADMNSSDAQLGETALSRHSRLHVVP